MIAGASQQAAQRCRRKLRDAVEQSTGKIGINCMWVG